LNLDNPAEKLLREGRNFFAHCPKVVKILKKFRTDFVLQIKLLDTEKAVLKTPSGVFNKKPKNIKELESD